MVYTPTMGLNGPLTAEKGPKNLKNDQNRALEGKNNTFLAHVVNFEL